MGNQINDAECFNQKMCVKSIHSKVMHRKRPVRDNKNTRGCIYNNIRNPMENNVNINIMNATIPPHIRQSTATNNNDIPAIILFNNKNNQPINNFGTVAAPRIFNVQSNRSGVLVPNNFVNTVSQNVISSPIINANQCTSCMR